MRKHVLALMDSEANYAVHFMEHVNRKRTSPFEVHAFTDREKLCEYSNNHRIEILLISEHDMEEGASRVRAGQTIVLTDGNDSYGLYPNVCKYQASSAVMRQVMEVYGQKAEEGDGRGSGAILKPPTRITGIFSPVARCMKTSFALAIGQCLARTKAVLYLNFEAPSGLNVLLGDSWERDISDVIYYIRRGERNIAPRLLPLVREIGTLGFVPPSPSPAEIYSVTADEWRQLFLSLRRDSAYESLVLDLGELPLVCPEILEECDIIYMPVRDDPFARAKIAAFEEELRLRDADVSERMRTLRLNVPGCDLSGENWAEHLPYSPLGQIARERITIDRL